MDCKQPLLIGSSIHLKNAFPNGGYLDTRGRVMDKPEIQVPDSTFVLTSLEQDRSLGSGTWTLSSATGKSDREPLVIGDLVHLENGYPDVGYLDSCGYTRDMTPFEDYPVRIGVFTASSKDRASGSGTWKVVSANGKANGELVMEGDSLHLENQFPESGYLDTCGYVKDNPTFKEYTGGGTQLFVFVSAEKDRASGSGTWIPEIAG